MITNYTNICEHRLTSSNVLSVDKYNRLWIGTMNGLIIFDKDSVKVLNTETGLPSNEILSLYYDTTKNNKYIGSAKGFSSMNISEFDNNKVTAINVEVKKVTAEDSVYASSGNYVFEPDKNNIHIDFRAINYSSPGSLSYQYKINNEWIDIPDNYVNFSFLKKGDYRLAIRAKVVNSQWGKPKIISFTVLPFFTETFLFRGSLAGILFTGLIFAAYKRNKYIKNKSKEKIDLNNQINELKHKALSSMMNPHFIFNSLNSVQYLVNSDQKREANDYIALMAKLIRMNLDTASNSYISLNEEIKRLDLYLQIEKLRFSDKFKYEISTGSGIDRESIMIPNMIIQPFVENSIWHGIMPSGRDGLIKLTFNFENVTVNDNTFKFLVIRIIDNGIGLTEAQKYKKDGHITKGIQIIQDRLKLISKEKNLPIPIIEDLNLKNKDTQGTKFVLSIPPELYKTISNHKL
ncbi:MAG: histidine kinase [Ignavibacteria bacterium]|nr:histidine kinase [Ignavibacteria bacterium]